MCLLLVLRLPRKMHLCRSSSNVPQLPTLLKLLQNLHVLLTFAKVCNPLRLPRERTSERAKVFRDCQCLTLLASKCVSRHNGVHFLNISTSKMLRRWCALYIVTWKRASRHSGVHFLNISTSKSAPNMMSFVYFDLETCFAPQWRAIFHLSSAKMAPHLLL